MPTQDAGKKCENKGGRDEKDVFWVAGEMKFPKSRFYKGVKQGVKHIKRVADHTRVYQAWELKRMAPESSEADGRSQNEPSKKERFQSFR